VSGTSVADFVRDDTPGRREGILSRCNGDIGQIMDGKHEHWKLPFRNYDVVCGCATAGCEVSFISSVDARRRECAAWVKVISWPVGGESEKHSEEEAAEEGEGVQTPEDWEARASGAQERLWACHASW